MNENQKLFNEKISANISTLSHQVKEINTHLEKLQHRQTLNQDEINTLQVEASKPRKWYNDPSTIISLLALFLSIVSALYYLNEQSGMVEESEKNKAKQIVQRLTDLYNQAGMDQNKMLLFQNEILNLVDEAIKISDENYTYINANGYNLIISTAMNFNKTNRLNDLFDRAFKLPTDTVTLFGMKNQYAMYNMIGLNNINKGRLVYGEVVEMTRHQSLNPTLVTFNLATEYYYWSSSEITMNQLNYADSLLQIAELNWTKIEGKYSKNIPLAVNIRYARHVLDSIHDTHTQLVINPVQ